MHLLMNRKFPTLKNVKPSSGDLWGERKSFPKWCCQSGTVRIFMPALAGNGPRFPNLPLYLQAN